MPDSSYPMALPPPAAGLNVMNEGRLAEANAASRESPRKRIIQPLHQSGRDPLQRMLNSLQPGTYIRPHRHAADRAESIVVLSGAILYMTFDEEGEVVERLRLAAGSSQMGVDTAGGIYHSFMALEPDTVLFEVKPGPYDPDTDKEFAIWAPEECSPDADDYVSTLLNSNS